MKAYKLEVLVIDFEGHGLESIEQELEYCHHFSFQIKDTKVSDIGEWSDDHPLNKGATCKQAYKELIWT